jgi:hypothetical protein
MELAPQRHYCPVVLKNSVPQTGTSARHTPVQARKAEKTSEGLARPAAVLPGLFAIDLRSLALFRMAAAALLLVDLAIRIHDLSAMYTDAGMFPRVDICKIAPIWNWSFHFASGSWGYQATLFGIAAILALALLVGFESRLAAIGSWLMLISLHHRVPPILSGADMLLRMLLFWAMFLPLGSKWSLDRLLGKGGLLRRGSFNGGSTLSAASACILIQIGLVYLFSAIAKSNADWFEGRALAGSLAHDFFASRLGSSLLHFPGLLRGATWATFVLEWVGPFLLFCPRGTSWVRMAVVAALALLHVGIAVFMEVGLFPFVSLAGLTLFLPSEFWDGILGSGLLSGSEGEKEGGAGIPVSARLGGMPYLPNLACLTLLVYVIAVNLNNLPSHPLSPLAPETWQPLTTALGLGQRWGMFDSAPSNSGWYVARAKLKDGSEVDLLRGAAPVDWKKPDCPACMYPNDRWRKLFREMAYYDELGFQMFRVPVAQYLCRTWDAQEPEGRQVNEFDFIYCTLNQARDGGLTPLLNRTPLVHLDLSGS